MQAAVTLLYPTCANPGHFLPDEQWSITRLQIATLAHDRDIANYNFKTCLIRAVFNELKLAIPNGIIADFLDIDNNFLPIMTIPSILITLNFTTTN